MPLTPRTVAAHPAERALFARLVDDAAVFPPARLPLGDAVRAHLAHRTSGYADLVGPLLVPASAAAQLLEVVAGLDVGAPLAVGVIARPGTDLALVEEALTTLGAVPAVEVASVEMAWVPSWRDADVAGLPLSLEVPRGAAMADAIADISADASDAVRLQAKLRTGATETWAWPDEAELARFVRTSIDHDVGFKLTGGLHHAVRADHETTDGGTDPQHGFLNVLVATRWALNGDEVDELVPLLAERDPGVLLGHVTRMSAADAAIVRAFFTAYGCCDVSDPVGELGAFGLIEEGA